MVSQRFDRFKSSRIVRRSVQVALGVIILAASSWVGLHIALNRDAFAQGIRARVSEQLATRARSFKLGSDFQFSWSGELWFGPLSVDLGEGRPTLQIERFGARPSIAQLLMGKVRPGRLDLVGVKIATDRRGKRLAELLKETQGPDGNTAPSSKTRGAGGALSVSIRDAWLFVEPTSETPQERPLGPFSLDVYRRRRDDGWVASGDVRFPRGGAVHGTAALSAKGFTWHVAARQVALAPWSVLAREIAVDDGIISGDLAASAPPDMSRVTTQVSTRVDRLVLSGVRIATEPVGPSQFSLAGIAELDAARRHLETKQFQILLGREAVPVSAEVELDAADEPKFQARIHLGAVALQKLIAALPSQVAPPSDGPHLDGPIAVTFEASGSPFRPEDWRLNLRLDTSDLAKQARTAHFLLRGGFDYLPGEDEGGRRIAIDATNPNFVPLSQLPPILGQAVITAEDSAFYTHHGFDLEGLQNGLAAAIEGGRLRGGSTLTQQLVKNLYLSPERTYARKISEALITVQVEAALPKSRILELYLNVIEWGPKLYGAGEAARYYFGVDARALTPKQAVFLASIIPNPTRWGPNFRAHGLTEVWQQRLRTLLDTLRERGFLDDAAYRQAVNEELRFRPDSEARPRAISHVP
jgi:penicillin-binding protein 1A